MGQFDGKLVMVTGACGGLGNVTVRRFADEGATLVLVDRDESRLDALIEELSHQHIKAVIDLGQPESVDALTDRLEANGQSIDVLVHTVGGYAGGTPVHEATVDEFEQQFYLNTRAVFVTCGRVASHMVRQGVAGKIIVTLSKAAENGVKDSGASSASKAAALSLVQSMAQELHPHNINVNGVSPSTIDSPRAREASPNADYSRWVTHDQIVEAFIFLASGAADRIRGLNLKVYG